MFKLRPAWTFCDSCALASSVASGNSVMGRVTHWCRSFFPGVGLPSARSALLLVGVVGVAGAAVHEEELCARGCKAPRADTGEAVALLAALEWLSNIEKESHWHGDEQDRPCLVLLEMTLSCPCQRTLLSRGIMRLVKEKDDKYTMRWYGLLKDIMYFEDDEWYSHEMQVLGRQVPGKEKQQDDGGMPAEPPVTIAIDPANLSILKLEKLRNLNE